MFIQLVMEYCLGSASNLIEGWLHFSHGKKNCLNLCAKLNLVRNHKNILTDFCE